MWDGRDARDAVTVGDALKLRSRQGRCSTYGSAINRSVSLMIRLGKAILRVWLVEVARRVGSKGDVGEGDLPRARVDLVALGRVE